MRLVSSYLTSKKINILINALPKSASLYIVRTLASTLSCETTRIGTRGVNHSQADVEAVFNFLKKNKAVAQDHLVSSNYNLDVLYHSKLTKFIVLFRDPRDALVSWAHHMEREGAANNPWHWSLMVSSGIISENYYNLSWKEKLNDLIRNYYPIMLEWMNRWVKVESDSRFNFKITTYEDFVSDKEAFIKSILRFYGLFDGNTRIVWPGDSQRMSKNINLDTHFRKGISGGYLEELSSNQIILLNSNKDVDLFQRFNWPLD